MSLNPPPIQECRTMYLPLQVMQDAQHPPPHCQLSISLTIAEATTKARQLSIVASLLAIKPTSLPPPSLDTAAATESRWPFMAAWPAASSSLLGLSTPPPQHHQSSS